MVPGVSEIRRVVFVRTDRLGETILNLPALQTLRQAWPRCHLVLVAAPALCDLFSGHPDLDEVVPEPQIGGSWWRKAVMLARAWRVWQADAVIISNPKKEYHVAAWLAGISIRVGYDRKWGWLLTHRIPDEKTVGGRHEVEYNLRLVDALGIPRPSHPSLQLPVTSQEDQRITQLFTQLGVSGSERLVAVHAWTSNPKKQWPVERFRQFVESLAVRPEVKPVLIGGPDERPRVRDVVTRETVGVVDTVGRLSLKELAACLRRVRVLVSNDSGPMHVAAAVGTPVVALFGTQDPGSHPRRWGPWGTGHTVIHKPLEEIAVDEVVQAVQPYL